jgi:hypothetical protein
MEQRHLAPRFVVSARVEDRRPAGPVKCQDLVALRRPPRDLHAGRTSRHARHRDACDRRAGPQEPIDDLGGHVALHDVVRDEGDVAGRQGGGDAKRAAEGCQILDVPRRDRIAVAAQVPDPRAATPSSGRPVHRDVRPGTGLGAHLPPIPERHRQYPQQHRSSVDPHGVCSKQ